MTASTPNGWSGPLLSSGACSAAASASRPVGGALPTRVHGVPNIVGNHRDGAGEGTVAEVGQCARGGNAPPVIEWPSTGQVTACEEVCPSWVTVTVGT